MTGQVDGEHLVSLGADYLSEGLGLLLAELLHLRDVRAGDKGLLARAADDQAADLA